MQLHVNVDRPGAGLLQVQECSLHPFCAPYIVSFCMLEEYRDGAHRFEDSSGEIRVGIRGGHELA